MDAPPKVVAILLTLIPVLLPLPVLLAETAASPDAAPGSATSSTPQVSAEGYTSARACGECHEDIYDSWKRSLHAFSLTDPIFDTAFMEAVREAGDEARKLCLGCHAPMTLVNGDYELAQGVTREGVSCDFCHTVTAVHLDNPRRPYSIELGLVKRSVIESTASPAHEVAYSKLHASSEFCGGCHNFVADNGTPIMTTYDEWKNGPYAAEGVQCQDCHMTVSRGRVVKSDLDRGHSEFHLHSLIHDSDQVRGALSVQILSVESSSSGMAVAVQIENVGSGHMVPTGIPTREVLLIVTVVDGDRTLRKEVRYRRVVADADSRILDRDARVLLRAAKIVSDNRIAPREKRVERFTFAPPRTRGAKVTAELSYVYAPMILKRQRMEVELGKVERYVF